MHGLNNNDSDTDEKDPDYDDGGEDSEGSEDEGEEASWEGALDVTELLDDVDEDEAGADLGLFMDDLFESRADDLEAAFYQHENPDPERVEDVTSADADDDPDPDFKPDQDGSESEDDCPEYDSFTAPIHSRSSQSLRKRHRYSTQTAKNKKRRVVPASPAPTPSPAPSPSPPASPSQSSPTSAIAHEYGGSSCSCAASAHAVDDDLPANSPEHLEDDCALMALLKLKFHKFHRSLICTCNGGTFVSLGELLSHYRQYHRELLVGEAEKPAKSSSRHRRIFDASVLEHFSKCLTISRDQKRTLFTETTLLGPIYGLADAQERLQCPYPSCGSCSISLASLRGHHRTYHKCSIEDLNGVNRPLCQAPYGLRTSGSPFAVLIPVPHCLTPSAGTETSAETSVPDLPQRYEVPEGSGMPPSRWLTRIGWPTWINQLIKLGWKAAELVALVAPPSQVGNLARYPRAGSSRHVLNWVERLIKARLAAMAEDANSWLATCSPEMRMSLSVGYALFLRFRHLLF